MAYLPAILILFLTAYSHSTHILKDEGSEDDFDSTSTEVITWPEEYYFKGEELNLKTGLVANFEIWSSANSSRCRRDYYGGIEKKYYSTNSSSMYYIFPMSDDENINEYVCLEMYATSEESMLLPDLSGANYTGIKIFEENAAQLWEMETIEENSKTLTQAYTLAYYGYHIPLKIITTVYDMEKGYVKSHTITNYYSFNDEVDQKDLDVEWGGVDCDSEEMFWQKYPDISKLSPSQQSHVHLAFRRFVNQHNKRYGKEEHEMRKAIFHENWKKVEEHNSKNLSYKMKVNKFADWTPEELSVLAATTWSSSETSGAVPFPYSDTVLQEMAQDLPDEVDLHFDGMLTPVKNQQDCGSCWAFASVAAVEGALALRNGGRVLDLSEQSLVDCAWATSRGCYGGTASGGLKYILAHGVPTDLEYGPYTAKNGLCGVYNMTQLYKITGFGQVVPRNPTAMKVTLNKYGPVVVGIHATDNLALYSNGVFYDISCAPDNANHAVTVVGYGIRDGDLFWLIKNSWGEDWGEDGYALLSANNNNCLLLDTAFYPII